MNVSDRRPILLIEPDRDDEILIRRAIEAALGSTPIAVVPNGRTAMDYLLGAGRDLVQPRLVILDLHLPDVEGLELLEHLRGEDRTRLLPVVVLANSLEIRDVVMSYGLGANSYVRKPVRFAQFSKALERIAVYWLDVNESPPDIAAS